MKNYAKLFLRALGYELKRVKNAPPSLIDFLKSRAVDLVADVGANKGQFGKKLRAEGYSGSIISFEPLKEAFAELERTAAHDRSWRVLNFGLSNVSGEGAINVSEMSEFSSLHPLASTAVAFDHRARVTATQRIVLKRLDELSDEFENHNAFLKIDTQGHEEHVIEGAGATLQRFLGIQLELPITPLYQSTWTLTEAINYMKEKGFAVCQITPVNKHTLDPAAFVEIDAVFRRADDRLDGASRSIQQMG